LRREPIESVFLRQGRKGKGPSCFIFKKRVPPVLLSGSNPGGKGGEPTATQRSHDNQSKRGREESFFNPFSLKEGEKRRWELLAVTGMDGKGKWCRSPRERRNSFLFPGGKKKKNSRVLYRRPSPSKKGSAWEEQRKKTTTYFFVKKKRRKRKKRG